MLDRYAADYPKGPHDQPQSMCPAFGSLRVGLRMRRTATILSGSACCVYGLTFTSHFYGARRTVGYVPFNSETLVTGKLFEDIREAVFKLADPALYDTIIITNLCVPTASGVPLDCCRRRSTACASSASTCRASACRPMPRPRTCWPARCWNMPARKPSRARCRRRAAARSERPTVTLVGEMFPADPVGIGMMLEPLGLAAGPVVPTREWRELYAALDCSVVAAIHPFYTASFRQFDLAGRKIVGSAPVGHDGTEAWLKRSAHACNVARDKIDAAKNRFLPAISAALDKNPISGRVAFGRGGEPAARGPGRARGPGGGAARGACVAGGTRGASSRGGGDREGDEMIGNREALICLPTYNERENVESICRAILEAAPAVDVLVIDDNSPDGTGAIADQLAARESRVKVLHRAGKEGLGKAYLAGFSWALERGYRLILEMDADFSHDPRHLPALLSAAREADLVLGSRYVPGGGTVNWGFGRRLLSRGGSLYARTILGVKVRDLTGGFKCFRREVLEAIDLPSVSCTGYAFQIELTYRAVRRGFRVAEVPIVFADRRVGQSKMSKRIVLEALRKVWAIRFSPFARQARQRGASARVA